MLTGMRHTAVRVLGCVLVSAWVACAGTSEPAVDIEATIDARLAAEYRFISLDEYVGFLVEVD